MNDSILNDDVVIFKMKVICEEIVEYFDENNPSWYDYFINKARRLLIFESIRIKKKNEKYIDEISQELQECYEEDENNKNEETELRINFLKNEITKYYENKKKDIEKRNKKNFENFTNIPSKKILEESQQLNKKPRINELIIDGITCCDQNKINNHIYNSYSNIFSENNNNYNLDEYVFKINPINDEKLIEK